MNERIGILGGGQLGKMLYLAGAQWGMDLHILDQSVLFPAGQVCPNFTEGDFTSYEDVLNFGKDKDILTVEIEKINVEALQELEEMGKKVFPQPEILKIIQDKGLQKQFYKDHSIPTSDYKVCSDLHELKKMLDSGSLSYPLIQKKRKDGYDGRGVFLINKPGDLSSAFEKDFIIEEKIDIEKELAVIVCRNSRGDTEVYEPAEMVFDPVNHILLYQLAPALLSNGHRDKARSLALETSDQLGIVGLLAIEMFLDKKGELMVNEVAPRPHNSGHHTIEASVCSQYENHLRAISGLPLGSAATRDPSLLMNLLGAEGFSGPVKYQGLEEILKMSGVYIHLYGKQTTRPHRKMGHITILDRERSNLEKKYKKISNLIKVIT